MDIFRGRYPESFENPKPIRANKPLAYKFASPMANHIFLAGHRIMVQVQSTWFPLYDRNPQTFVPNIFFAKPEDYVKATQRSFRSFWVHSKLSTLSQLAYFPRFGPSGVHGLDCVESSLRTSPMIFSYLGHRSFDSTPAYVNPSDGDAYAAAAKAFSIAF